MAALPQTLMVAAAAAALATGIAIVISNLLERRGPSGEFAAARLLKDQLLHAELQFCGGAYADQDGDGVGEFGLLAELAGGPLPGRRADLFLKLMPAAFQAPEAEHAGYRFIVYLPDGRGGALAATSGARVADPLAAKEQARHFVAYAWPSSTASAQPIFALTERGLVHRSRPVPPAAEPPPWNALWDGKGWKDPPAWALHAKR